MWKQHDDSCAAMPVAEDGRDLVPVIFLSDEGESTRYLEVLVGLGIPASLGAVNELAVYAGRPLLVPAECEDRACEILAALDARAADAWEEEDDDFEDDDEEDEEEEEDDEYALDDEDEFEEEDEFDDDDEFEEEDDDF